MATPRWMRLSRKVILQKFAFTNTLFQYYPARVKMWDGSTVKLNLRQRRLIKFWRRHAGPHAESEACFQAFRQNPGDVLDIGAFRGWFAMLFAPLIGQGKITCFEPDPTALPFLLENLASLQAAYPAARFSALPYGAGDGGEIGAEKMGKGLSHDCYRKATGTGIHSLTVDGVVNAFGLRPTFIKIDVEGAEWEVLQGAGATLAQFRPTVMVEIHRVWLKNGITEKHFMEFFQKLSYSATELADEDNTKRVLYLAQ